LSFGTIVARLENSLGVSQHNVRLLDETAFSFPRPESGNWRFAADNEGKRADSRLRRGNPEDANPERKDNRERERTGQPLPALRELHPHMNT
jgi:hypothetical protein